MLNDPLDDRLRYVLLNDRCGRRWTCGEVRCQCVVKRIRRAHWQAIACRDDRRGRLALRSSGDINVMTAKNAYEEKPDRSNDRCGSGRTQPNDMPSFDAC